MLERGNKHYDFFILFTEKSREPLRVVDKKGDEKPKVPDYPACDSPRDGMSMPVTA